MERALYNGILSGMALDGKSFFYVNPLEVNPKACHNDERKFHVKPVRQKWFGCACCPPNIARLLSSIGSYAYTENEDTLFVHLYIGSIISKKIGNKTVDVNIISDFPWDGNVRIKVRAVDTDLKIALRIPDWCDNFELKDSDEYNIEEKDGYLYIGKAWNDEDEIAISFPMEPCLVEASNNVREDMGKVALARGPIVYCLEEKDNGNDLYHLKVNSNTDFQVGDINIEGTIVKKIEAYGTRTLKSIDDKKKLYHKLEKPEMVNVTLTYIPYYTWANRGENEMQVWTCI
jgi:hypothetical protein